MKLSTKSRYAVRGLLDLAVNCNSEVGLIKDIANRQTISESYLENLFTVLRAAGLLESSRGRGGGFRLAKAPHQISVLEVIETLEGSISLTRCIDSPTHCSRSAYCVVRDVWRKSSENLKETFSSITLQDLLVDHKKRITRLGKKLGTK
jgi:Rrf2 family cysteine metabolism transcriptional repressor